MAAPALTPVDRFVRHLINRQGPVPFATVVELSLYHPDGGFYMGAGSAGRRGDFLTSVEVGPLFGELVARALDAWWHEMGRPQPFVVVEAGAGPGTLATAVLAATPACGRALRYVLVERSPVQRARHRDRLPLADPVSAFPDLVAAPGEREARAPSGDGPIAVSLAELPRLDRPCVVLANELLDNLPFDLAERGASGWQEVRIGLDGDRLIEVRVPLDDRRAAHLPQGREGARVPLQQAAAAWVREAVQVAGAGGRVVALDYASTTAELAERPWRDWLRTHRHHAPGLQPLEVLGTQDITCDVAVDQLPTPTRQTTQAEWLGAHGIDALVEEGRRTWHERASIGDLAAVRARSRVTEAEALLDPAGLGGFAVLEWER